MWARRNTHAQWIGVGFSGGMCEPGGLRKDRMPLCDNELEEVSASRSDRDHAFSIPLVMTLRHHTVNLVHRYCIDPVSRLCHHILIHSTAAIQDGWKHVVYCRSK